MNPPQLLQRAYIGLGRSSGAGRFIVRHRRGIAATAATVAGAALMLNHFHAEHRAARTRLDNMVVREMAGKFEICTERRYGYFWTRTEPGTAKIYRTFRIMGEPAGENLIQIKRHVDFRTIIQPTHIAIEPQHLEPPAEIREHLEDCARTAQGAGHELRAKYPKPRLRHQFPVIGRL